MLVDFSFENFGPFKDKTVFSMLRVTDLETSENLLECEALQDMVLNTCAIVGPNSSGKSNVIKAVSALQKMVAEPIQEGTRYTWYNPFRYAPTHSESPTTMEIRFTSGPTLYHYTISYDNGSVVSESLSMYNNGHKEPVFNRNSERYSFGRSRSKGQKAISGVTSPSSSYLAVAARFNNEPCSVTHRFITRGIRIVGPGYEDMTAALDEDARLRMRVMRVMDITDFGSASTIQSHDPFRSDGMSRIRHRRDLLEHESHTHKAPLDFESTGAKEMLALSAPLVCSLEEGSVLMVDEFGSNLHPDVCKWIVKQFRSRCNPKCSQMVLVTNNPGLTGYKGLFRRDQVFYTRRDGSSGACEMFSASDFDDYGSSSIQPVPFIPGENIMD